MGAVRGKSRLRRAAVAGVLAVGTITSMLTAAAGAANAWPGDPHVILNGRISCPAWGGPYDTVQWAWVDVSPDSYRNTGWASLGSGGTTKPYTREMWNVGTGGETVTVKYGCAASGEHRTTFGLNRPAIGIYATRNIY